MKRMLRAARARIAVSAETGSAVAEFVMVAALLTALTLGVMQLGLALHVRNTVLDAAAEGARYASLADSSLAEGAARTRDLIQTAVGPAYATGVTASYDSIAGYPCVHVRVVTPLPLLGLFGIDRGLEVDGHAARETLE
ncbi:TadE/TadG family type IV pilus assembly protein [Cryobacterium sp. CG_9.6]|uniref:TadE/TadG family type IV pilus assembly protein n=1 Tax=Cryobacterium sp. CG_9.6 TaxID=2760710 RepID=UPI002475D13C|nr:TadE/TadG family type IV pilus assembly protein [Cryobacterium sp. CG_9.6]MDH6236245.1 Flp pilus assembly protein TadG [Cryobacterium sp. CG_9.6]